MLMGSGRKEWPSRLLCDKSQVELPHGSNIHTTACGFRSPSHIHTHWGQSRGCVLWLVNGLPCLLFWSWSSPLINVCQSSKASPCQSEEDYKPVWIWTSNAWVSPRRLWRTAFRNFTPHKYFRPLSLHWEPFQGVGNSSPLRQVSCLLRCFKNQIVCDGACF